MRSLSRVWGLLSIALLVAVPLQAQSRNALLGGRVTDADGKPLVGAIVVIDSLAMENAKLIRIERQTTKVEKNGEYRAIDLIAGRTVITIVVNNVERMKRGEKNGDEIYLIGNREVRENFNLKDAAPLPPKSEPVVGPAPASATGGLTAVEREEMRKKIEMEAALAGEIRKLFDAGQAAYTAKNYEEAVRNFKLATERAPLSSDILWANLGKSYDAHKKYPESAAAYQKAIEAKPTDSNYYVNLSLVQFSMDQIEEGTASIEKAVTVNPANGGKAFYNLGAVLFSRGKIDEAINALNKAISFDASYANAHFQLGLALVSKEKNAEAVTHLEKFLTLAPTSENAPVAKDLIEAVKPATSAKK